MPPGFQVLNILIWFLISTAYFIVFCASSHENILKLSERIAGFIMVFVEFLLAVFVISYTSNKEGI